MNERQPEQEADVSGFCGGRQHQAVARSEIGNALRVEKKRFGGEKMNLKRIVPDMEKLCGKMRFGGLREEHTGRVRNVRSVVTRDYNVFSEVQKEEIPVRIPGRAGTKPFAFRDEVKLVNPRLIAEGRNINGSAFVEYLLEADDIVKVVAGGK